MNYKSFVANISLCFMNKHQERLIVIRGQKAKLTYDLLNQKIAFITNDGNQKLYTENLTNDELFQYQIDFYLKKFSNKSKEYVESSYQLMKLIEMIEKNNLF